MTLHLIGLLSCDWLEEVEMVTNFLYPCAIEETQIMCKSTYSHRN